MPGGHQVSFPGMALLQSRQTGAATPTCRTHTGQVRRNRLNHGGARTWWAEQGVEDAVLSGLLGLAACVDVVPGTVRVQVAVEDEIAGEVIARHRWDGDAVLVAALFGPHTVPAVRAHLIGRDMTTEVAHQCADQILGEVDAYGDDAEATALAAQLVHRHRNHLDAARISGLKEAVALGAPVGEDPRLHVEKVLSFCYIQAQMYEAVPLPEAPDEGAGLEVLERTEIENLRSLTLDRQWLVPAGAFGCALGDDYVAWRAAAAMLPSYQGSLAGLVREARAAS